MEKHAGFEEFESEIKGRVAESMAVKEAIMKDTTLIHDVKRIIVKIIMIMP